MSGKFRSAAIVLALALPAAALFAAGAQQPAKAEVVEVTVTTYHTGTDSFPEFADTAVGKKILADTGVKVNLIGKPAEVAQAVLTDMAAGKLPDLSVFWVADSDPVFNTMVKGAVEGQLAPLEDSIRKNSPVLTEVLDKSPIKNEIAEHFFRPEFNKKIYILPTHHGNYGAWISGYGLYVRGDAAEKLKIPTPDYSIQTPDDLYNLLVKIKAADFRDVNGNPAYPMGSFTWDGNVFGAMAKAYDFGGQAFMGIKSDGKVEAFIRTDYAWQNIAFMRKLIKERLVDPEMFTDASAKLREKIAQGRYVVWPIFSSFAVTKATAYVKSLLEAAPQMAYRPLGNMFNHMGNRSTYHERNLRSALGWSVSGKAKVDSVIKLMDWMNSRTGRASLRYGIEGETWNWNQKGFAQMLPEAFTAYTTDQTAFGKKYGAGGMMGTLALLSEATGLDAKGYDITGTGVDDVRTYQNSPDEFNLIKATRDAVMPDQHVIPQLSLASGFVKYPKWNTIKPVWDQMQTVLRQAYLVDTDAEARKVLDSYRDTLAKNGLDDFIAFMQKEYDANKSKYTGYIGW